MARYDFDFENNSKKKKCPRRISIFLTAGFSIAWLFVILYLWPRASILAQHTTATITPTRNDSNEESARFPNKTSENKGVSVLLLPWLQEYTRLHASIMVFILDTNF